MADILEFKRAAAVADDSSADGPWLSGPVRCVGCGHKWEGASPVGVISEMECPACGCEKGIRTGLVSLDTCWQCNCGSVFFVIGAMQTICAHCGSAAEA